MTAYRPFAQRSLRAQHDDRRAVIDIGSNTVRLVVYDGPQRSPRTMWNEKIVARLGRDLASNGRIPEEACEQALAALTRFALLVQELKVHDVQTVATAAAREAENGAAFLDRVRALGLDPRLLTGEEEAVASAFGVIGAFPDAHGVVADLGGGSLELVGVDNGDCHSGASLPLGTLRLPALRARKSASFKRAVQKAFQKAGWAAAHTGPLYMVGGTWRALAAYAMRSGDYPLTDPHGFRLDAEDAMRIARKVARSNPEKLVDIDGIGSLRAGALPDAAAMLQIMLAELEPDGLVFSSWGLREGLLYQRLEPLEQTKDPLIVAVADFAAPMKSAITDAALMSAWVVDIAEGGGAENERLRLAGALLSLALHRVEPNFRTAQALEWALDKRWVGLDARGRAMIAAMLLGSCNKTSWPKRVAALTDEQDLREAMGWGLAMRLARRLGATSRISLMTSALARKKKKLVLRLDESRAALAGESVTRDLAGLAEWLGLDPELQITA
ncbi:Ppx/GppA family phosphatase [Pelagerythrobacter marensis]|uniref:Exopolyphosphatase n=1 Tax=Pelagerythrobacter marensis TaxID=543877 RepID=A0A0G3X8A8_9SPHN|nr:Ppx/GppA family phosphatase [Pelagerythrobacter marensis]AKM06578.1 Exopolyphosphatase [Pelagerythrobacter marensis]